MTITNEMILESIEQKTVLELSELIDSIKEKFNVKMPVQPVIEQKPVEVEEAKTEFDVVLLEVGEKRVQVIKAIRSITGLALAEIKNFISDVPQGIKEQIPEEEAKKLKAELEEIGAKVELR